MITPYQFFLLVVFTVQFVTAIPIENGVEGDPEVECGPSFIAVNFNTQNPFEGHVFVKGLFAEEGCRNDEAGSRVAGIQLPFDACNVRRTRSLNPRGLFVDITIIISFHPQFITKVDRAYTVQCFYMEADKSVSADLEVSMLTTAFQTQVVPMPVCKYEILDGSVDGSVVRFALVGAKVYHKWTCDTETIDTFCMIVHTCYVDDGQGDRVDLLDENGCAQDKYLIQNLEYFSDMMAGQESHVFKYADRAQLFFQCQITLAVKEPNLPCPTPDCVDPVRGKRRVVAQPITSGTLDVTTTLESLDLDNEKENHRNLYPDAFGVTRSASGQFCMSPIGFAFAITVALALLVCSLAIITYCCLKRPSWN